MLTAVWLRRGLFWSTVFVHQGWWNNAAFSEAGLAPLFDNYFWLRIPMGRLICSVGVFSAEPDCIG